MDKSLLIGIIGTIATIIFGFLSIDLFRRKKYPGKITYVKLTLIDLLNNVANNFNEITLLHRQQPINKNIIYLKGALINNGDIDINSRITEKDITLELPEKCKWLDIKPTDFSEGLNVTISSNDNRKAVFQFDLFRKNEFIQFEGLIESESSQISSDEIDSSTKFTHRIENTSKIEKKILISESDIKKKKRSAIIYTILLLLFIVFISSITLFNVFGSNNEKVYFRQTDNKSNEFYSISRNNNYIVVTSVNGKSKDKTLSINDFSRNYVVSNDKLNFWGKFKEFYWVFVIQSSLMLLLVVSEIIDINKARKLTKILKK